MSKDISGRRALQSLVNSSNIFVYFLTTALVGLFGAGLYDFILRLLEPNFGSFASPLGLALVALVLALLFGYRLAKKVSVSTISRPSEMREATKRPGLILLLSERKKDGSKSAAEVAIDHHGERLTHLWILHSPESREFAEDLKRGCQGPEVQLYPMVNLDNIAAFYKQIDTIYSSLPYGLQESDVVTDYTGMTKSASVGAVLACHSSDRPLQYVKLPKSGDPCTPPMEVIFTLEGLTQPLVGPAKEVAIAVARQSESSASTDEEKPMRPSE